MVTNRTPLNRSARRRLTPEVIAAWKAGDESALHRALGLFPWDQSPLPREIEPLGVDQADVSTDPGYQNVMRLQWALLKVAGWPECRADAPHRARRES